MVQKYRELLQITDNVARDKMIDKAIVIEALEEAIKKAARTRYGHNSEIRVQIDPKSGELKMSRLYQIVEEVTDSNLEVDLESAQKESLNLQVGDFLAQPLPMVEFGRVAAQSAKQVINQKVRSAERDRQYNDYKDSVGQIASGKVKRIEYGNVIVDLGRGEGMIRRSDLIAREVCQLDDRIRAYIVDVVREQRGPQIKLSRTHPDFVRMLFRQEVPEIYEGVVQIMGVVRDHGSRAKIAVRTDNSSIDPVGACVGMRGVRVQAVSNELQGEKIDIVPWSDDPASFIVSALAPAEVSKVVLDEDLKRVDVVVSEGQLSLAIGRRGQNVRLASQLTGWDIELLTEDEESQRRQEEFVQRTNIFMTDLNVDETVAQLLAVDGFTDIQEIAYVNVEELGGIEGFGEEMAEELQKRAKERLQQKEDELSQKYNELGLDQELTEIEGLSKEMLVALAQNSIKTVKDLGYCSVDELIGWDERNAAGNVRHNGIFDKKALSRKQAEELVMMCRLKSGLIEPELETDIEATPEQPETEKESAPEREAVVYEIGS